MSNKNTEKLKWPSVSFAIATYNSQRTIERCLNSVFAQDYEGDVEVVIADGGSRDNTVKIAQKKGAKVVKVPPDKQGAEYNKGVAVNACKNEVVVMIDHDNILPHKNWLKNMIRPLVEDREIFGTGVLRFHHERGLSLLDRYFALIGGTDPVAFFFNKSAHQSYLYDGFKLRGKLLKEEEGYFVVKLDSEKMPALGGNGAAIRRKVLSSAKSDPENFFHIDIHVDLVEKGIRKYAFVKDTIIHLTNNKLIPFLKRRRFYIEKYHFEDQTKRRFSIYEPKKDRMKLALFVLYALSFFIPLIHAIKGFFKIRDTAWFIHPFMCLGMLFVYGVPTARKEVRRVFLER